MQRFILFQYKEIVLAIPADIANKVIETEALLPLPGGQGGVAGLSLVGGSAVPLLDMHRLVGLPRHTTSLGLVIKFNEQEVILPIDEVIGNFETDKNMMTTEPISPPQETEDYRFDYEIRVINPEILLSTLQARVTPV